MFPNPNISTQKRIHNESRISCLVCFRNIGSHDDALDFQNATARLIHIRRVCHDPDFTFLFERHRIAGGWLRRCSLADSCELLYMCGDSGVCLDCNTKKRNPTMVTDCQKVICQCIALFCNAFYRKCFVRSNARCLEKRSNPASNTRGLRLSLPGRREWVKMSRSTANGPSLPASPRSANPE